MPSHHSSSTSRTHGKSRSSNNNNQYVVVVEEEKSEARIRHEKRKAEIESLREEVAKLQSRAEKERQKRKDAEDDVERLKRRVMDLQDVENEVESERRFRRDAETEVKDLKSKARALERRLENEKNQRAQERDADGRSRETERRKHTAEIAAERDARHKAEKRARDDEQRLKELQVRFSKVETERQHREDDERRRAQYRRAASPKRTSTYYQNIKTEYDSPYNTKFNIGVSDIPDQSFASNGYPVEMREPQRVNRSRTLPQQRSQTYSEPEPSHSHLPRASTFGQDTFQDSHPSSGYHTRTDFPGQSQGDSNNIPIESDEEMTIEEHSKVLGISTEATLDQLKTAYRKLSLVWHPDRNKNPDAPEMIKRINRANEELKKIKEEKLQDDANRAYLNRPK